MWIRFLAITFMLAMTLLVLDAQPAESATGTWSRDIIRNGDFSAGWEDMPHHLLSPAAQVRWRSAELVETEFGTSAS